ncbi:hypothetical protein BDB00DRAFT_640030 [Zychaea mexicana]|uniref:uncharacterized protein n=1 Tax=Zychaea mexicana TaxID=64656 RepID=UPI0022FE76E9|nr:uncharacterized protein BDB00DRAFT_640030 [Zychaea mexicana]KAI9489026.1 hypothetical protein BDB00DRAFT_640030 [Zychaea mexicana]
MMKTTTTTTTTMTLQQLCFSNTSHSAYLHFTVVGVALFWHPWTLVGWRQYLKRKKNKNESAYSSSVLSLPLSLSLSYSILTNPHCKCIIHRYSSSSSSNHIFIVSFVYTSFLLFAFFSIMLCRSFYKKKPFFLPSLAPVTAASPAATSLLDFHVQLFFPPVVVTRTSKCYSSLSLSYNTLLSSWCMQNKKSCLFIFFKTAEWI